MTISNKNAIMYSIVFVLIYATDTFITFANTNAIVKIAFQALILALAFYLFLRVVYRLKHYFWPFMYFACMAAIIAASIAVNGDYAGGNFLKAILLWFGFALSLEYDRDSIISAYLNIMFCICVFSLLSYVLSPVLASVPFLPRVSNLTETTAVNLFFSVVPEKWDDIVRNYGPFWEPGVYAIYLNLALLLSLKRSRKIGPTECVFIVGVLTTVSTSGYAVLLLILIDFVLFMPQKKDMKIVVTLCMALAILLLLQNPQIKDMIQSRFDKNSYAYNISTKSRSESVFINLSIAFEHPLFGAGANGMAEAYSQKAIQRVGFDLSNASGMLINGSEYGLIFMLLYWFGFYKLAQKLGGGKLDVWIVFGILSLMMLAEPLILSLLFNTLPFLGIQSENACERCDEPDVYPWQYLPRRAAYRDESGAE